MRPIQLTMNAFGPYRGKVELDFTKFNSSSIFLVSGATGSGKTTIFDALTYALYNKASGDMREADMLKSQFATDEDKCYVELTFEMKSTRYRIKRNPTQTGPGKRQKTINIPADVEFYKEDKLLAEGNNQANKMIEALLGLSYQQFRQIVLLPQGEFRKLLLSDSREKENIFRNIFETENIQKFQDNLNKKRKDLQKIYDQYETKLEQSIADIDQNTFIESQDLEEAVNNTDYENILKILEQIIKENTEKLTGYKNKIEKLNKKISIIEKYLQLSSEIEQLKDKQKELNTLEPEIKTLEKKLKIDQFAQEAHREYVLLTNIQKEIQQLNEKNSENKQQAQQTEKELVELRVKEKKSKRDQDKLEDIRLEVQSLAEEIKTHETLDQQKREIKKTEKSIEKIEKEIEKHVEKIEQNQKNVEQITKDIQKIDLWRKELTEVEIQYQENKENYVTTNLQIENLENILQTQRELNKLLRQEKNFAKKAQKAQAEYKKIRKEYFSNLAGILADELVEEEPCPVCGSVHHPDAVAKKSTTISEDILNDYEEQRNQKQTAYTEIEAQVQHVGKQLVHQQNELSEKHDLEVGEKNYIEILSNKEDEATKLKEQLEKLEQKQVSLKNSLEQEKTWREELEQMQESLQENTLAKVTDENKQLARNEKIKELEVKIEESQKTLNFSAKEEVIEKKEKLQNQIKSIEETAKEIANKINKKINEKIAIQTSIDDTEANLKTDQKKEKEQATKYKKILTTNKLDENFQELLLQEQTKKDFQQQIDEYKHDQNYNSRQLNEKQNKITEYESLQKQNNEVIKENLVLYQEKILEIQTIEKNLNRQTIKNETSFANIEKNYEESKEISEPLSIYADLAEIANGSSKRTNYVSFERYVLSIYFSEILIIANKRFQKMTNNRYKLIRREDSTKGRGADGLEINIFDQYSGKERSVRSLSGGETFKASLALALGLSDVIQNQQGGVHVDTLFIDEGFGTLDDDSLEMAIETLMELQTTGRLIGIISHVDELKDRIPARILVENRKEGSDAQIEVS